MKKYIIAVFILVTVVLIGIYAVSSTKKSIQSPNLPSVNETNGQSPTGKNPENKIKSDNETVKVLPGQSNILLADEESRILFGNTGSEKSVPDVIFGSQYSLNDIHKINYLPIRDEISFYSKGNLITLKNLGCNKETRFTDIREVWVKDCTINVSSQKAEAPFLQIKPVSKEIITNSEFKSAISDAPFIYIKSPRLSLMSWTTGQLKGKVGLESGSMTSYSPETPWDISLITAYGIDTLRYSAEEIFNKVNKQVTIGQLKIDSEIASYDCKVIFKGTDGGETKQCDNISIKLTVSGNGGVIKLVEYTE